MTRCYVFMRGSLGRSEVLRKAVNEYLSRTRATRVGRRYRRAYEGLPALGDEWSGWEHEGSLPPTLEPLRRLKGFVKGIDSNVPREGDRET